MRIRAMNVGATRHEQREPEGATLLDSLQIHSIK